MDGIHYYAMELIEGCSLDRVLRRLRQAHGASAPSSTSATVIAGPAAVAGAEPAARATEFTLGPHVGSCAVTADTAYFDCVARMAAEVADALEHTHKNGVIHRDVKPGNLLLPPDGRLSVNDFGLARVLEQPGVTATGEFVGTPAYMSPEQIAAGRTPLGHRTDVYSLGATLYELLTLRPPFQGERHEQVLAQVLHKDPVPPRRLNRTVPVDLETICLKAMDKDPDRRYQTAGEMAQDLRRYLHRFAIRARRAGPLTRLAKWARRRPGMACALAALLAAVLAAGFFARQAQRARDSLLAEQGQAALEATIVEALSGDWQAALRAINRAENRGVSPGQLNLLRGLIEQHRGNAREAVVYLEQAERQLPDSVAVKALLAQAYQDDGRFDRFDEGASGLEGLEPHKAEDYLFLALAQSSQDPDLEVDVEVLDVTDEEARALLLSIDLLTALAQTQEQIHRRLLELAPPVDDEDLRAAWQAAADAALEEHPEARGRRKRARPWISTWFWSSAGTSGSRSSCFSG